MVSCPIALFPASSERETISFHQLHKSHLRSRFIRKRDLCSRIIDYDFGVSETIRAQAKPPGYLVALVTVKDDTAANEYREKFMATLPAHGGKYLVRGGQMAALYNSEGAQRIVVVQFPSFDKAKEWADHPKVVELRPLRDKAQTVRGALVEGAQ